MKNKTFFAGSIFPPLIIGCITAVVSAVVYFMNPVFSVGLFFLLLTVLVTAALINFAIARDEEIVFFSFLCIPTRYKYSDIISKITLEAKPENRFTGATILFLKNGKRKLLKLGLYPAKTQKRILELLDSNINTDFSFFHDETRWDIWFQSNRKRVVIRRLFIGLLLILIGLIFQIKTVLWNWKAGHWNQSSAVIEVNQKDNDVYQFRYQYQHNGKTYKGFRIFGGAVKATSDYVPGMILPCVINPENPEDAYIITNYRADWLLSAGGFLLIVAGLPFLFFSLILSRKKIQLPEELKKYPVKFAVEHLKELTFQVCGECKISVGKISGKFREIENRYGCFPPHQSVFSIIILLFFLALSVLLGIKLMPHFLIAAVIFAVLIWKTIFPRGVVFDWQEKKIYWFHFFSCRSIPAKIKYTDVLKAEDITALGLTIRNDGVLLLSGVRKDGVAIPVARASDKHMEQLFKDSLTIAKKLGDLPIITI